jgi:prevent-host-death family protein
LEKKIDQIGHNFYDVGMEKFVSVFELKAKLSEQLELVESGEHLVVTRNGKPVAKLVPFEQSRKPLGSFAKEFAGWESIEIDGANWLDDYPDWVEKFK